MRAVTILTWPSLAFGFVSDRQQPLNAASKCRGFKSYTALGDSYAGGFGSDTRLQICNASTVFGQTCTTEDCGQDIGSYAYKFAKKYGTSSVQNLACNGFATWQVLDDQVNKAAFGQPDLVTVNMGGDDNSFFANVVLACVVHYDEAACTTAMQSANSTIHQLNDRYEKVFSAIKAKVPSAQVVAMSYAQFWGNIDADSCAWPLNIPSKAKKLDMNELAKDMNARLKTAALNAHYLYGDVDHAFQGHRLCDASGEDGLKSWFQLFPRVGLDTAGDWYYEVSIAHPTASGQDAMLETLENVLGC